VSVREVSLNFGGSSGCGSPVETFEYKVFKSATELAGETLPPP